VIVTVPGTSVVPSTIGAPFVSILKIGRLIWAGAGVKEEFVSETVTPNVVLAEDDPDKPVTVAVVVWEFGPLALWAGNAAASAFMAAVSVMVPVSPALRTRGAGEAATPDGRLLKLIAIGPLLAPEVWT
jgi:hypothetical protein